LSEIWIKDNYHIREGCHLAGKKNIFEKLGLVESVDENLENNEFDQEGKMEKESTVGVKDEKAVAPTKEDTKITKTKKELTEDEKQIGDKLDVLIESYERDKLLSVDDIYRKASLVKTTKDTIFMANVFLKALPENLPTDVKRESLWNIMKASEIRVEELLSDAYERIDALNNVLEKTVTVTEDVNKKHENTINELENRIKDLKKDIQDRLKFQESQNTSIEYEIQKIINLVEFIKAK